MSSRPVVVGIVSALLLSGCTKNDIWPWERVPLSSVEYLMFGRTGGMCGCDAIYMIADGKLSGASNPMINNPDTIQLTFLPQTSYDLVSSLTRHIPDRIVKGSSSATNAIGSIIPDFGNYYVEVSQHSKVYRWHLEPRDLPSDLADFVTRVQDALSALN